jgi:hypothetical protein
LCHEASNIAATKNAASHAMEMIRRMLLTIPGKTDILHVVF